MRAKQSRFWPMAYSGCGLLRPLVFRRRHSQYSLRPHLIRKARAIYSPLGGIGSCASSPALNVTFEGLAPGFVGVEQIQFVVPANQQPGDWALFFNIGTDINGNCPTGHETPSSGPYVKIPVR